MKSDTPIGKLPAEWQVRPLGELLMLAQYGLSVRGNGQGAYPILRMTNQVAGRIVARDLQFADIDRADLEKFRVQSGDLLFNRTNSFDLVGRTAIFELEGDFVFASYLIRLRTCASQLNPHFLNFYLNGDETQRRLKSIATRAVSQSNISATRLKTFQVPVPPLDEQRQIARVLSAVQRAVERQERLIALTAELKKALMHKLFTEGTRGEPLKETEIGPVPESWDVMPLGKFCKLATGTTPSTADPSLYHGTNAFIKTDQIINARISTANLFVSDEALAKYGLKVFQPGTILMAMYGQGKTRGQVGILDIPASITQNAAAIVCGADLVPGFLYYYLMSQYRRLRQSGFDGQISHLNLGFLKRLFVPCPPCHEQEQIAEAFAMLEAKEQRHRAAVAISGELFRTLLHKLMTEQVRVHDLDLSALDELAAEPAEVM